jgi:Ca-activated chloride channel family protein
MCVFLRVLQLAFVILIAGIPAASAALAASVNLKADLGQRVINRHHMGSIYLRLSLRSLVHERDTDRTPVNVAIVLDRSGSMKGSRMHAAKRAARMALRRLGSQDVVSLVAYNDQIDTIHPASRLFNGSHLEDRINDLNAKGRTALYAGVKEGVRQVREVLLGEEGIPVTTIGLGLQYNEDLMSRLALSSDGNHAFAEKPSDLDRIFDAEFGDVLSVAAQDITIRINIHMHFRPIRVLGRSARIEGNKIHLRLNQLYANQERYLIVELKSQGHADVGTADVADLDVEYLDLQSNSRQRLNASAKAEISIDGERVKTSINKSVMTQVTTQIATERNEKAVTLRDKGDLAGARQLLQDNADYLKEKAREYSAPELEAMERKNKRQAQNLDDDNWARTRKSMRHDQHRSKVQQSY